jgi:hypothetical protein
MSSGMWHIVVSYIDVTILEEKSGIYTLKMEAAGYSEMLP